MGVAAWELMLPGCASLKEKRQVVLGLKDRLHARFKARIDEWLARP